jgi:DNA-binding transcriptional ArsR family regulator
VPDPSIEAAARAAHRAGTTGIFDGHPPLVGALEHEASEEARGWRLALIGQSWFATREPEPFPYRPDAPARSIGAAWAAFYGARAAVLSFDAGLLERWVEALGAARDHREAALLFEIASAWLALARGESTAVVERGKAIEADARRDATAAIVIEAAVLQALAHSRAGDLEEATRIARRASRMARTESLPQEEYLANVVLARVRRLVGRSFLAARILGALLRVAPAPWHRWMSWELALSTGISDRDDTPRSIVRAALGGDRTALGDATRALSTAGFVSMREDVALLAALVDPQEPNGPLEWLGGRTDAIVPGGLHGVCSAHPDRAFSDDPVWVIAAPGWAGRRMLSVGLPLVAGAAILEPGSRRRGRTDAAIAALVLHGPEPLSEETLFSRLYGFSYQPRLHQGARDTLYYRVRERLGDHGELERGGGAVRIRLERAIAVPDPRCAPPPEYAILAVLAERGQLSVKAAADALGIPLRTAQHALRALAEDGACSVEKDGRELRYRIEDTTFSEATRSTQDV